MNTKPVELFIDLYPGWQDGPEVYVCGNPNRPLMPELSPGQKRVKVVVHLPCFGGSAEVSQVIHSPKPEIIEERPSR